MQVGAHELSSVRTSSPGSRPYARSSISVSRAVKKGTARYDLLGVEHLDTFALTLDPLQQFALSVCKSGINCLTAYRKLLSYAELLSTLAAQRASHARQVTQDKQNHPRWVSVSLTDAVQDIDDRVSIKVKGEPAAFAGSAVAFSRRPYAGCIVTKDSNGLATCTVEDPHGDEHSEDEENGPIIATYSGKLLPDLQFLPTTQVLSQKIGRSRMDLGSPQTRP
jgi:hypothetical protein